jgi:hypothetical protein
MMIQGQPVSPSYREPLFFSAAIQIPIQLLAALMLDNGGALFVNTLAIGAFWIVAAFICFRRPHNPTPRDLTILRLAYPVLICHVALLVVMTWKWQGRL